MKSHISLLRHGVALLVLAVLASGCSETGGESSATTAAEKKATTSSPQTTEAPPERPTTTTSTTPPPPTTGGAVPEAAEFALGSKANYDDGSSVHVFGYEQPAVTGSLLKPPAGKDFASVDVEVCTGTRAQTSITSRGLTAYRGAGGTYPSDLRGKTPSLVLGLVPPGQCQRGFVTFIVPTGERASYLVWQETGWEMARWPVG